MLLCGSARAQVGFTDRIGHHLDRAPSLEKLEAAADSAYSQQDYYSAIKLYQRLVKVDSSKVAYWRGLAKAAIGRGALGYIDKAYAGLLQTGKANLGDAELAMWADVRYQLGNYDGADSLYQRLEDLGAPEYREFAQKGLEKCAWARTVPEFNDHPFYTLDTAVNTLKSEFAPYLLGSDTLQYASFSFPFAKDKHRPKRDLIGIKQAILHEGGASDTSSLHELNTPTLHTANVSYNKDRTVQYFSRCEYISDGELRCDLYMRKLGKDGKWSADIKLPAPLNSAEYTETQPNVGTLPEANGGEVLFFVSDRPGAGKRDIWYAKILPDGFADPQNLRELNTAGNDVTPFFHQRTQALYFSTDGRKTLGGLDVYRARLDKNVWGAPSHLPRRVNSGANDVYYHLLPNGRKAYFASNRAGLANTSEEDCCYDIYVQEYAPPVKLVVEVFDKRTKKPLAETRATYRDFSDRNAQLDLRSDSNAVSNIYRYDLEYDHNYKVLVEKPGYTSDSCAATTVGLTDSATIYRKVYLTRGICYFAYVVDGYTNKPLDSVTFNFVEIPNIRRVEYFSGNTNMYADTLNYDSRYKISAFKEGYSADSLEFSTATRLLPKDPFQCRIDTLRLFKFLPITLYFDNDHPNPRTRSTKTDVRYQDTYFPNGYVSKNDTFPGYISRKEVFLEKYLAGSKPANRVKDSLEVVDFFDNKVKRGWDDLMRFSEALYPILQRGDTVRIILRGFASPLANSDYNKMLTARRVECVHNHFRKFDEFVQRPSSEGFYQFYGNQLFITELPLGELPGGNDKPSDRRNSVFSVEASEKRKLEILGAIVKRKDSNQ